MKWKVEQWRHELLLGGYSVHIHVLHDGYQVRIYSLSSVKCPEKAHPTLDEAKEEAYRMLEECLEKDVRALTNFRLGLEEDRT